MFLQIYSCMLFRRSLTSLISCVSCVTREHRYSLFSVAIDSEYSCLMISSIFPSRRLINSSSCRFFLSLTSFISLSAASSRRPIECCLISLAASIVALRLANEAATSMLCLDFFFLKYYLKRLELVFYWCLLQSLSSLLHKLK